MSQKKTRSVGFTSLPKRPHDDDVDFDIAGDCFKLYFCKSRAETSRKYYQRNIIDKKMSIRVMN